MRLLISRAKVGFLFFSDTETLINNRVFLLDEGQYFFNAIFEVNGSIFTLTFTPGYNGPVLQNIRLSENSSSFKSTKLQFVNAIKAGSGWRRFHRLLK